MHRPESYSETVRKLLQGVQDDNVQSKYSKTCILQVEVLFTVSSLSCELPVRFSKVTFWRILHRPESYSTTVLKLPQADGVQVQL